MLTFTSTPVHLPLSLNPKAVSVCSPARGEVYHGDDDPIPLPDDLPNGTYTVHIQTGCGCFTMPINLKFCPTPTMPSESPDLTQPTIIECCDP